MKKSLAVVSLLSIGATSSIAHAGNAVVPPLVTRGMDPLQTLNLTSLVASELDFLGEFDMVDQLESAPSTLNSRCLEAPTCLYKIVTDNGASGLLAGAATINGDNIDLMLVFFNNGRMERSKNFSVENSPSVLADSMSGFVREVVTGESIQQVQTRDTVSFSTDTFSDDDLFSDGGDDLFEGIGPIPEEDPINRTIPTSGGSASSELDDLDLDLLGNDLDDGPLDDRPIARAPEPEPEPEPAFVPVLSDPEPVQAEEEFTFEFASSIDSVTDADTNTTTRNQYDDVASSSRSSSRYDDLDEPSSRGSRYDDLDEPSSRGSSSRGSRYDDLDEPSSRSSASRGSRYDDLDSGSARSNSRANSGSRFDDLDGGNERVRTDRDFSPSSTSLTARLGRSTFQSLEFVTYGVELGVMVSDTLRFAGGIEPHSTKRDIPPALLEEGEPSTQWNTIVPVNVGLQYLLGEDMWRPYIGGDVIMIPGYVTEVAGVTLEGGRTATGARARVGIDVLLSDSFALNANLSYGMWSGKDFDAVERELADSGSVPQVSAGTVIRF